MKINIKDKTINEIQELIKFFEEKNKKVIIDGFYLYVEVR